MEIINFNPAAVDLSTAPGKAKKLLGISYLGNIAVSHKLQLSFQNGVATYGVYLAPADMSGHNVCPASEHCKANCLAASGHNKIDILAGQQVINNARIRRTLLFFQNRPLFVKILFAEIERAARWCTARGIPFSCRINCTSDLSLLSLVDADGKNIFERFPGVQFYDYTKVVGHLSQAQRYENYDLTFSYDGYNWDRCRQALNAGVRVAVVFRDELPATFNGVPVIDGNKYDYRYMDPAGVIVGLSYHTTANDFITDADGNRHFIEPDTPFVVRAREDARCTF